MKAVAIDREGNVGIVETPKPEPGPGEVLVRTRAVGVCATDREMVRTKSIYTIPDNEPNLILGHEGMGSVVEAGPEVSSFVADDVVVPVAYINDHTHEIAPSVVVPCRIDMCPFGTERRRGINTHGYFREFFSEKPDYLVKAPPEIADIAMLLEPLTVTLKGIREAHALTQRWMDRQTLFEPEEFPQRVLIIGAGPIGMLGIALSRVYGWETVGVDLVVADSIKAEVVTALGARYVNARETSPAELRDVSPEFDIIIEAVQEPRVVFDYLSLLAMNGVFVVVGWTASERTGSVDMTSFVMELLGKQAAIVSTVGASRRHYEEGMRRLVQMRAAFGPALDRMVTGRYPVDRYQEGLDAASPDEIKTVLEF